MMDYKTALKIATDAHEGQVRKWSGLPYITHPTATADKFTDLLTKITAVSHDLIEDTKLTLADLVRLGYPKECIPSIDCLTHKKHDTYLNYLMGAKNNHMARRVKIADIEHNMSDLEAGHLKDKYMLALHILRR